MPPRKKSEKNTENKDNKDPACKPIIKRIYRKRVKQEKRKLKEPTIVKVKISSNKNSIPCKVPAPSPPPIKATAAKSKVYKRRYRPPTQSKAINGADRKIELANEVALAQLGNLSVIKLLETPENLENHITKKRQPLKKRRKPNATAVPMKKVSKQKVIKKPTKLKTVKASKKKADSTTKTQIKKSVLSKRKQKLAGTSAGSPSLLDNSKKDINEKADRVESEEVITTACPKNSRKTSSASEESYFSWTKDISSSSTTTCLTVASNDVVRIDSKMPVVQLANIDTQLITNRNIDSNFSSSDSNSGSSNSTTSCSSNSDSQSNSSIFTTNCTNSSISFSCNSISKSLNLSRSTPSLQSVTYTASEIISSPPTTLNFLQTLAQKFDMLSWRETQLLNNKDWPEEKRNIISLCLDIRHILESEIYFDSDKEVEQYEPPKRSVCNDAKQINVVNREPTQHVGDAKSSTEVNTATDVIDNTFTETNDNQPIDDDEIETLEEPPHSPILRYNYPGKGSFDCNSHQHETNCYNDDDDVLSLIAESYMDLQLSNSPEPQGPDKYVRTNGLGSSKITSSAASICAGAPTDEYVSAPTSPEKHIRISFNSKQSHQIYFDKPKPVCEKQNADSTSLYKDTEQAVKETPQAISYPKISVPKANKAPLLISACYKPSKPSNCCLFKGVCFFNLISNCRRSPCRYTHATIETAELENRLSRLRDDILISDYMLIRTFTDLRQLYGLLLAREFKRRCMTRVLLEMIIDFSVRTRKDNAEDQNLRTAIMEVVLQHLKSVYLYSLSDLLSYTITGEGLLCEILMKEMVEPQKFTRFKMVFLDLANFTISIGRTFQVSFVSKILECVCFLPFEAPLVRGVYLILLNTDDEIFSDPRLQKFEQYMLTLDKDLYEQFLVKKAQALLSNPEMCSLPKSREQEQISMRSVRDERYVSPDTTRNDNSNKPPDRNKSDARSVAFPNFKIPCLRSRPAIQDQYASATLYRSPLQRVWRWRGFSGPGFPRPRLSRPVKRHMVREQPISKFPRLSGPPYFNRIDQDNF